MKNITKKNDNSVDIFLNLDLININIVAVNVIPEVIRIPTHAILLKFKFSNLKILLELA
jgi:vacuolar-type H+-ATPase subunit C/Vma6